MHKKLLNKEKKKWRFKKKKTHTKKHEKHDNTLKEEG